LTNFSIQARYAATVISSVVRAILSFVTGIAVARALGPGEYGNFAFLIGSFAAIKQLLEMGSANAFFTFISQKPRGRRFVMGYVGWQATQLLITLLLIGLLPKGWIAQVWVGQERQLVILAFLAVFLQQQAWQTVTQIGESMRLTQRVQAMNVAIAVVHLGVVLVLWWMSAISVVLIFLVLVFEHVLALFVGNRLLGSRDPLPAEPLDWRQVAIDYWTYCKPLVLYSWLGFSYAFADAWLLQHFGGAREQAYFAVGQQFAAVSLLATTAMLQIFWKEIAEAYERKDMDRVARLYQRISKALYIVAVIASGFLIPWSTDIARVLLGTEYVAGAAVLAIMFLFPVHQSLGQIAGTLLFATARTKPVVVIGMISMAASIPLTYFLQAPADAQFPGLALGAMGMSLKWVGLQIVTVNVLAWWVSRSFGWRFDWEYQVIGMGGAILIGWLVFSAVSSISGIIALPLVLQFVLAGVIYLVCIAAFLWALPSIAGWTRDELKVQLCALYAGNRS
jgi:O-antigen/teichoic acid export membrane protein